MLNVPLWPEHMHTAARDAHMTGRWGSHRTAPSPRAGALVTLDRWGHKSFILLGGTAAPTLRSHPWTFSLEWRDGPQPTLAGTGAVRRAVRGTEHCLPWDTDSASTPLPSTGHILSSCPILSPCTHSVTPTRGVFCCRPGEAQWQTQRRSPDSAYREPAILVERVCKR